VFKTTILCGTVLLTLFFGGEMACGAALLNDPTRPPAAVAAPATATSAPHWQISSILYSQQRRVAVVNGRLASEGDVVDGATVVAIRPDAVELLRHGRHFSVALKAGLIKESFSRRQKNEGKQTP
jgi:MSHA biogenesis protein MshK